MRYDEISLKVREIVANLFERDAATLSDDTLLMQDLPCESIDLLEVSVQLGATFHIFVRALRPSGRSAAAAAGRLLYGCRRHGPAIAPDPGRHRPLGGTGP